jgi:alkylation response protein AidB-like acyl-CoA dehydrogenase
MTRIEHPSNWIDGATAWAIRRESAEAEANGRLTVGQLDIIYRHQWFRMFVPKYLDGPGLDLSQVLRTEEALAWTDGSVAWVVTLCSGAGWFVGFLDPKFVESIVHDEHFCIAGSGAVTGTAVGNDSGYLVNGSWKYASGCLHATALTANCETGSGVKSFVFLPSEISVKRTWNSMGMIATGSHSFEVRELPVAAQRAFVIDPAHAVLTDPIYQYPFAQLAETTLAVNLSGLTSRFIDLCEFDTTIAAIKLGKARHLFYETVDGRRLHEVSMVSRNLVRTCRETINQLYPLCGLRAADRTTEINRVWRNFHTAAQHSIFNPRAGSSGAR